MAEVPSVIYPTGYSLSAPEIARYGASHRYTSWSAWEAGEDIDWVTATDNPVGEIIGGDGSTNWSTVGADTSSVLFKGYTLNTTYYLTMETLGSAIPDFTGGIDTTAYRLVTASVPLKFQNAAGFVAQFKGIQIVCTGGAGSTTISNANTSTGTIEFKNCYIKNENSGTAHTITTTGAGAGAHTWRMWNCIIQEGTNLIRSTTNTTTELYHCVFTEATSSAVRDVAGSSITIKNCVVFNNSDDFLGTFASQDYCANDDNEGSNPVNMNENAGGEWTNGFTDYANSDFSVKDASSILYNAGTSLTSGSAPFTDITGDTDPLANDILGNPRSTNDINAFVLVSAPAAGIARSKIGMTLAGDGMTGRF